MQEDASKATDRIVELLREQPRAIPFVVGWLSYGKTVQDLQSAVDRYFAYEEDFAVAVAARKLANEAAQEPQE